jgi:hypothetical protein
MGRDLSFRFQAFPASEMESYVVRGLRAGPFVEISLSRDARHRRHFGSENYEPIELLALKRFRPTDIAGYSAFAGNLEVAADIAARGKLGYTVHTSADNGRVRISLVGRLLAPDGRVRTAISHEQSFDDPDTAVALVQANERAVELSGMAEELNDEWASERNARVSELRADYDRADADADAAEELQRIVDGENR